MTLSTSAISEFRSLYFNQFDIHLSEHQANEFGLELLNFFKLIYRPMPKDQISVAVYEIQ